VTQRSKTNVVEVKAEAVEAEAAGVGGSAWKWEDGGSADPWISFYLRIHG
jgi:hypothetical protein